jgi:hypothetical protein
MLGSQRPWGKSSAPSGHSHETTRGQGRAIKGHVPSPEDPNPSRSRETRALSRSYNDSLEQASVEAEYGVPNLEGARAL